MEAKVTKYERQTLPQVLRLTTGDGGVEIPGAGAQTILRAKGVDNRSAAIGTNSIVSMELDRALGGVVVHCNYREKPSSILVPMGHIKQMELAD